MELQDFIASCLVQICTGIGRAQEELSVSGDEDTIIAPNWPDRKARPFISFDITCTIRQETSGDVRAGAKTKNLLEVIGFSAGVNGKITNGNVNENLQKISFDVPFAPYLICDWYKNRNAQ